MVNILLRKCSSSKSRLCRAVEVDNLRRGGEERHVERGRKRGKCIETWFMRDPCNVRRIYRGGD